MVTAVRMLTLPCLTVNTALSLPAETMMVAGVDAAVEELLRSISIPPAGAGLVRVTMPVTGVELLPLTDVGFKTSEARVGGSIVSDAVCEPAPSVDVIPAD